MKNRSHLFCDSPEELEERLVAEARLEGPTPEARARALANIAAASAATAGAGLAVASLVARGAGASTSKWGALIVAKWLAVGAVTAVVAVGVHEVVTPQSLRAPAARSAGHEPIRPRSSERSAPHRHVTTEASESAQTDTLQRAADDDPAPVENLGLSMPTGEGAERLPSPAREPLREMRADVPRAAHPQGVVSSITPSASPAPDPLASGASSQAHLPDPNSIRLTREIAALEQVRSYLARQMSQGALDVLDAYEQSFPAGAMKMEASVLRIEALAALPSRRDEAKARGQAFLVAHPKSPLHQRVRATLAQLEPRLP